MRIFSTSGLIVLFCFYFATWNEKSKNRPNQLYIDNGRVRLGIDLESGGCVFYFSESATRRNLLNHHDKGRFIQQSYYGDEDGSRWAEREWRWNPVQGGGYRGHPARVLEYASTANSLYVKSMPKHWATGADIDNAVMEQWIVLEEEVARIRYRFLYTGHRNHEKRQQEMPAVFVDFDLPNLVFYEGSKPWTNDKLTATVPGWPNEMKVRDEHWAAYVDDENWGMGVYTPGTREITCYRYKGPGGPIGSGCSYFAPLRTFAVSNSLNLEYQVYLTIGTVSEIRERFYRIRLKNLGRD